MDYQAMKENCIGRTKALQAESDALINKMEMDERNWVAMLRKQGYKAAHPNDGWVDRKNNIVSLCYPQFEEGDIKIGDKLMLGWPFSIDENVPVEVTSIGRVGPLTCTRSFGYKLLPNPEKDARDKKLRRRALVSEWSEMLWCIVALIALALFLWLVK